MNFIWRTSINTRDLTLPTYDKKTNKKWIGGNRDSSSVVYNNKINTLQDFNKKSIGKTKNPNVAYSQYQALTKNRGGGYVVPPKVTQKYLFNKPTVMGVL